jgi:hypothetical protein
MINSIVFFFMSPLVIRNVRVDDHRLVNSCMLAAHQELGPSELRKHVMVRRQAPKRRHLGIMGRCRCWRQQAAGGCRRRWRIESRHVKPLVPAGVVCWARRLALRHAADWWCGGGACWVIRRVDQLRRRVPPRAVAVAAADGQELVQGRVHHRERLRVLVGVERQRHGGGVEDLRERVVVEEEVGDHRRRDRRELPRRRMLLIMRGGVHAAAGRGRRSTARRWRVDAVVDEAAAAGGVLVVVLQQVVVVGERRHHRRRRLAGLLVDPAKHPVVQLRKKKMFVIVKSGSYRDLIEITNHTHAACSASCNGTNPAGRK